MELFIYQHGNYYSFKNDSNIELFVGRLNSIWVFSGQLKALAKDLRTDETIATSKSRLKLFPPRAYFDITYKDTSFQLKFGKLRFSCSFKDSLYELIPHKGYLTSIFQDGLQIGYYETQAFSSFNCFCKVVLNNKADLELICTFILAVKCDFSEERQNINIDFGNFGREAKPFDYNWSPDLSRLY